MGARGDVSAKQRPPLAAPDGCGGRAGQQAGRSGLGPGLPVRARGGLCPLPRPRGSAHSRPAAGSARKLFGRRRRRRAALLRFSGRQAYNNAVCRSGRGSDWSVRALGGEGVCMWGLPLWGGVGVHEQPAAPDPAHLRRGLQVVPRGGHTGPRARGARRACGRRLGRGRGGPPPQPQPPPPPPPLPPPRPLIPRVSLPEPGTSSPPRRPLPRSFPRRGGGAPRTHAAPHRTPPFHPCETRRL